MKLSLTFVAAALLAAPAFADSTMMDPATMTCADLMKMDMQGMTDAGMALKTAMMDDAKVAAMSDADVTAAAETACKAHPEATVMDAMHM